MIHRVYLSRRNLQTLLNKLDRVKAGGESFCSIIKSDNQHSVYSQTLLDIQIVAIENEDYYTEREPGEVLEVDEPL